ncbi:uncharacterized protein LOC133391178 [Anopheles gambiae]|uniref:uncharacterized protein LOC133391178 n=1 Tax=Anopheles gambiae TaxID=7165 RepID=UPI002AC93BD3|nr:uncharacterized protein LOC133391178 [Anopheles gambiae]
MTDQESMEEDVLGMLKTRKLKTTSNEDRERIVQAREMGSSVSVIAKSLNIKRTTVYNVLRKYHATMKVEAEPRGKVMEKKISPQIREQIKRWIDEDCSTSLEKITYRILEQFQVRVCRSTVAKEVGDFNYSLKRLHLHGDQKHEGDIVAARQEYANALSAMSANVPDNSVVFIGEEAFKISVRVMRAKPCSGNRAFKIMPEIRIRNVTVLCAMNRFGILHYLTRNRAIDRSVFSAFIDELIVKLRLINIPRAVIIMDDVPTHTSVETKSLFEQGPDELMYLPLQSSFLNPIETLFSSWKQICNRANPNSEEEVIAAIENGQDLITPTDSEGCFQLMWSHVMFETIQN